MPLIKLKHISSFSSEDTAQPSSNLLKPETYRKWRCAEPGEKQAVVVIELEKATKIHSIDIGNNGSALIEVLVGRSSDTSVDAFKVLLVTSSFMTPADGKSFTNTSRVRMFGHDKLSKPVADEKWDKVKIVCTQPFNKNERYGLSFISLHSPPEDSPSKGWENVSTPKRLGSFTLKDEEGDNDIKPGSLFFQKKKNSPSISSTAAKVRDASCSSSSLSSFKSSKVDGMAKSRQPVAIQPKAERERKPEKQDLKPVKPDQPVLSNTQSVVAQSSNKRRHDNGKTNTQKADSPPPKKTKKSSHSKQETSFHEIMKGVVFVLSGFKNPERGEIRDQALEMGAQYKPDWTTGCTHLICAFSNTPKYYQVKGKGKIVTKRWISDCHRKRRKLPTRKYHLPGDTSSSEDSSDDEPANRRPLSSRHSTNTNPDNVESKSSEAKKESPEETSTDNKNSSETSNVQRGDQVDPFDVDTDDEIAQERVKEKMDVKDLDSDKDTEDELERIHEDKDDDDDIYNLTTEDEQDDEDKDNEQDESSGPDEFPELPDFFSKRHFLLYGEMDQSTRRTLIRYITAYDGTLEDYMTERVDFVITYETWDQNFEDALSENASLAFIKPAWIVACHEKSTMVPFQPYIIAPS